MKERRKRKNLKRQMTDQHQSQKATTVRTTVMSCQTSSCEEPVPTTTFGPFQDHPHPPIGNIFEKLLIITWGSGGANIKMSLLLTHHVNQAWYELGMNH